MDIDKVSELARTIAALPQAERDAFDGLLADVRKKDTEARRVAKLRAMNDLQALDLILIDARRGMTIFDLDVFAVGRGLAEAGFSRSDRKLLHEAHDALEKFVRNIIEAKVEVPGGDYVELNRLIMQAAKALSKVETEETRS